MTLTTTTLRVGGGFQRYELLERIGIGGMAEVFKAIAIAKDGSRLPVVVKKILPHLSGDPHFRTMFLDEARILSFLDHPNLVAILDVGKMDDDLFLAMEFVDGCDLLRLIVGLDEAGKRLPVPLAIFIAIEVLKALQHAHDRTDPSEGTPLGIVHRDVTPANVLASVTGDVKLTDFGIARAQARQTATAVGIVKGNVLYISPEQLTGGSVDSRTDIYGAGMLFHRLLAGRHAFEGEPLPKIYQRSMQGDIPPPSNFNPAVPKNLDSIVAHAISRAPAKRFQTADEFRTALENFAGRKGLALNREELAAQVAAARSAPGAAQEPSIVGRLMPLISEAVGSAAGSKPATSVFSSLPKRIAPADAARPQRTVTAGDPSDVPTEVNDGSFPEEVPTTVTTTGRTTEAGYPVDLPTRENPVEAAEVADRVPPPRMRAAEVLTDVAPIFRARGHQSQVSALADLRWGGRFAASGSHDQTVRIWDLSTHKEVRVCRGHTGAITSMAVFRDGMRLLTSSADETVRLWATEDGRCLTKMRGHTGWVHHVSVAPDGSTAISAGEDKTLRIWDVAEGSEIFVIPVGDVPATAVSFLGEGALAVSVSKDKRLRLWNALDGSPVGVFEVDVNALRNLAITADGRLAVLGGAGSQVQVWDLSLGKVVRLLRGEGGVSSLALSPDGRLAAVSDEKGVVRIWELRSGQLVRMFEAHPNGVVASVSFVLEGTMLLTGAADGTVAMWEV